MSNFRVNDIVRVCPSDDLDAESLNWEGKTCTVVSVKQGQTGSHYIRIEDPETKHRVTLRETDLVRQ